ncbi:hypothetical protein L1049_020323 [Liquidambar formosana]|uniref:Uncharacterized protein n=1 Tax=Liquidambar formosana TaxID=63359 RepID=A0AAP0X7A1_LIQFO
MNPHSLSHDSLLASTASGGAATNFLTSSFSSTSLHSTSLAAPHLNHGSFAGQGCSDDVPVCSHDAAAKEGEDSAVLPRYSTTAATDANSAIELALDSVVKIFTVSSSPSYSLPWQNGFPRESTGSGFVIPGKRILTNAHVVADHTFLLVRKHGSPTKYRAKVQAVGHECDLAILVVENEEFWEGMDFLELGEIPVLQEAVAVVRYPKGGDNICVTNGVVSRVKRTKYVHAATQIIAIEIDVAINPGNSGGPAIMGNKVVGVAFQNLSDAENIGHIIPVPPTENVQLRNYFRMGPGMTGVLVSKINPLSDAHRILKKDDIILAFDNVPIANDGTVPFRNGERIAFDHLVSMKKPHETAEVRGLRNGEEYELSVTLQPLQPFVPVHQFDKLPSYFIFAGLSSFL